MNFINKLKKDKKFRIKFIMITILVIFIYTNFLGPEKKEALTMEDCELSMCHGTDCHAFLKSNEEMRGECAIKGCVVEAGSFTLDYCVNCVADGKYTEQKGNCCSGQAIDASSTLGISECGFWDTCFKCISVPGQECNAGQRLIAGPLMSTGINLGCITAYYLTLIGGALMLLVLII